MARRQTEKSYLRSLLLGLASVGTIKNPSKANKLRWRPGQLSEDSMSWVLVWRSTKADLGKTTLAISLAAELHGFGKVVSPTIRYRSALVRAFSAAHSIAETAGGRAGRREIQLLCHLGDDVGARQRPAEFWVTVPCYSSESLCAPDIPSRLSIRMRQMGPIRMTHKRPPGLDRRTKAPAWLSCPPSHRPAI